MIHVCYGLFDGDGRYSKWTGTSMLSMFENTAAPPNSITVHILHDTTLTPENRDKFNFVAERYNQQLKFHNVEELCPDKIQFLLDNFFSYLTSRFSIGAFYRLFVKKSFFQPENISKLIYLDADTIVNLDIVELWNYPIADYVIAAVPEKQATRDNMITDKYLINSGQLKAENYFCSGVIVLNLEKIGENFFYDTMNWLAENLNCECPDQDALNHFFSTNYCRLPEKFNAFVEVANDVDNNELFNKIYHYSGDISLGFDMQNAHDKLFFSYFIKTPWFNENTIAHMFEAAKQIYIEQKELMILFSSISAGKNRVFFLQPNILNTVKNIFSIKNTEKIIIDDTPESLQKLIRLVKKSHDKNFFFIFSQDFDTVKKELEAAGFNEKKDFINAASFLHDKHGVPMPTKSFLKSL